MDSGAVVKPRKGGRNGKMWLDGARSAYPVAWLETGSLYRQADKREANGLETRVRDGACESDTKEEEKERAIELVLIA